MKCTDSYLVTATEVAHACAWGYWSYKKLKKNWIDIL